jgi:SAM-dependent methyltransferase
LSSVDYSSAAFKAGTGYIHRNAAPWTFAVFGQMNSILDKAKQLVFGRFTEQFTRRLNLEIEGTCETLLDVGCGSNSPIQHLSPRLRHTVGIDAFAPAIDSSRALGIHDEYYLMDALKIGEYFHPRSFDCVLASDLVEHLNEQDGLNLISQMEKIARKKVIIFTPNGYLTQGEYYNNPLQKHLSGWTPRQMRSLGYHVIGIQGLKWLRGELAQIRWRPTRFWLLVSLLTQLFTTTRPDWAFRLLCIKDVEAISRYSD